MGLSFIISLSYSRVFAFIRGFLTAGFDPLDGSSQQLRGVFAFKFFLDAGAVHFDRPGAEIELLGNFARGESFAEAFKNFFFAGS